MAAAAGLPDRIVFPPGAATSAAQPPTQPQPQPPKAAWLVELEAARDAYLVAARAWRGAVAAGGDIGDLGDTYDQLAHLRARCSPDMRLGADYRLAAERGEVDERRSSLLGGEARVPGAPAEEARG